MIKAACFDLETTSLNADFGILLCGVIKPSHEKKPIIFRAEDYNKNWKTKRANDSGLVNAISRALEEYDILVAHNGAKFDLPYLRTRLMRWGCEPLATKKILDPVLIARKNLRMSSNSLRRISDLVGMNQKTEVSGEHWMAASLDGCQKSMNYIVDHCVKDVVMLEQLVDILKPYSPVFNSWGSS